MWYSSVDRLGAVHIWRHAPGGGGGQAKVWQFVTGGGVNVVWRHTIKKFIVVPPLILYTNLFNIY